MSIVIMVYNVAFSVGPDSAMQRAQLSARIRKKIIDLKLVKVAPKDIHVFYPVCAGEGTRHILAVVDGMFFGSKWSRRTSQALARAVGVAIEQGMFLARSVRVLTKSFQPDMGRFTYIAKE